ncbi:MAG: tetratricopeptide repeat protein [Roseiarcus sp.]
MSSAALVVLVATATSLGGCEDMIDLTGSIAAPAKAMPTSDASLHADADEQGKRYDRDPGEKSASIDYARALRALTRYGEAAAVMQTAAVRSPHDIEVLGAYGKALADSGQLEQAKEVLAHACTPDRPNPTIMSVQGAVDDELGDHEGARRFYRDALKIAPGDPAILNNLGLSYVLTKQLPQAEAALRKANASPRADARQRDNLALVLALERKFAKAQEVSRTDMPAEAAAADARAIRRTNEQSAGSPSTGPTNPLAYASE